MCGCNSGSSDTGASVDSAVADTSGRDDQVYVVTYFNGESEEAVGLDAVRNLLINPAARIEGARDEMQGGTYAPKR